MLASVRRMYDRSSYHHELIVLGRQVLDLLLVSRDMTDWLPMWMYRQRLAGFQERLHKNFLQVCISRLKENTRSKVPKWEIEAILQTAARRSCLRGREYALEQALMRPMLRNRRKSAYRWIHITDKPLPLQWMDAGAEMILV